MTAYARALERNAMLAPEDGSVAAFVRWYRALGFKEKFDQSDVYADYVDQCSLMGLDPVSWKHFGEHLTEAGFAPKKAEKRKGNGKRHRPMTVDLSRVPTLPISLPRVTSAKPTTAMSDTRAKATIQTQIAA